MTIPQITQKYRQAVEKLIKEEWCKFFREYGDLYTRRKIDEMVADKIGCKLYFVERVRNNRWCCDKRVVTKRLKEVDKR